MRYQNIPKLAHVGGLAVVLVGGLALAACTSGGGGNSITGDDAMGQPAPAVVQEMTASNAINAAMEAVDALSTASTAADVTAAEKAVMDAIAAITEGTDISGEDVTALTMRVAEIQSDLTLVKATRRPSPPPKR